MEKEVKVLPSEVWKLYGNAFRFGKFIVDEVIPGHINKFTVLQGQGATGTVIELFYPSEIDGGPMSYKEKLSVVDDEKRVKVSEVVEGGYLDLGFTKYGVRLEILKKEGNKNECITRAIIEYELKEEAATNVALISVQPLLLLLHRCAHDLEKSYNN